MLTLSHTIQPQFPAKRFLPDGAAVQDVFGPWTATLADTFEAKYGYDLMDFLPEVFWDRSNGDPSTARYHYHAHVSELFVDSFIGTISKWCKANGILSAGHMLRVSRKFGLVIPLTPFTTTGGHS